MCVCVRENEIMRAGNKIERETGAGRERGYGGRQGDKGEVPSGVALESRT